MGRQKEGGYENGYEYFQNGCGSGDFHLGDRNCSGVVGDS
jgi:hypothetical protein